MVFSFHGTPTSGEIQLNLDDAENFCFTVFYFIHCNFAILINSLIHEILLLMSYVQKPPVKAHGYMSSTANGLIFGLSLHLHPYFEHVSSEDSGSTCLSNTYQNPMC